MKAWVCRSLAVAARHNEVENALLKRLRHFAGSSGWGEADFEIADAVDPDRIETFAIGRSPPRVVMMLRERFGDKLRHLPG